MKNSFKKFYEETTMKSKTKIYLDMDGVLCDFKKGVFDVDGKTDVNDLFKQDKEKPGLLWKHIDKVGSFKFFSSLKWLDEGKKLWKYLKDKNDVEILSSLGDENKEKKETHAGKQRWLKFKNITIPQNFSQRASAKKKWVKGKQSILIDDYDRNIKEWEEAGGTGILFTTADKAIKKLESLGENIIMEPYVIIPDKSTMIDTRK